MLARSLLVFGALTAFGTFSGAAAFEGRYIGGNAKYSQSLTISRIAQGYKVTVDVATPGCVGEMEGVGTLRGASLLVQTHDPDDTCELVLTRKGQGLSAKEKQCSMWHGMRCGFDGDYRKR
jgi:hypothetical protein